MNSKEIETRFLRQFYPQAGSRYYVVRHGLRWHVKCGEGTRSLARTIRKIVALRIAAELETAFQDGMYVVTNKLRGGGRHA